MLEARPGKSEIEEPWQGVLSHSLWAQPLPPGSPPCSPPIGVVDPVGHQGWLHRPDLGASLRTL